MYPSPIHRKLAHVSLRARTSKKVLHSRDFAFHMTDWTKDLHALARLYRRPNAYSQKQWDTIVQAFLIHTTGHLLEAARLYGYVSDPFGVIPQLDVHGTPKSTRAKKVPKRTRTRR